MFNMPFSLITIMLELPLFAREGGGEFFEQKTTF